MRNFRYNNDIIYHNECCCLFASNVKDDECNKRYFQIRDWKTNETKMLFVCNEYIRCKLNEKRIENNEPFLRQYDIDDVIKNIISKYCDFGGYYKPSNDLIDETIWINVCERPYLNKSITVKEGIEAYIDSGFFLPHIFHQLKKIILRYMKEITYKKYKTKYVKVKSLLHKIDNIYSREEREILMNEMLVEILDTENKLNQLNKNK